MVQCSFINKVVVGSSLAAVTKTSDFAPALSKESLDIQGTMQCGFILKHVLHFVRTYRSNAPYR